MFPNICLDANEVQGKQGKIIMVLKFAIKLLK